MLIKADSNRMAAVLSPDKNNKMHYLSKAKELYKLVVTQTWKGREEDRRGGKRLVGSTYHSYLGGFRVMPCTCLALCYYHSSKLKFTRHSGNTEFDLKKMREYSEMVINYYQLFNNDEPQIIAAYSICQTLLGKDLCENPPDKIYDSTVKDIYSPLLIEIIKTGGVGKAVIAAKKIGNHI